MFTKAEFPDRPTTERNDCVVRALAVAAEVSYTEAHAAVTKAGRKFGKRTDATILLHAVEMLGLRIVPGYVWTNKTVNNVLAEWDPKIPAAIWVRGHLIPIKEGKEYDMWQLAGMKQKVRLIFVKP